MCGHPLYQNGSFELLSGNEWKSLIEKKGHHYHEMFCMRFSDHRLISLGTRRKSAENKMLVNQNGKRIEVTKCSSTKFFDTSAIVIKVSFGEPSYRDYLSSNNQPTLLKNLIFQAKYIQLQKVRGNRNLITQANPYICFSTMFK